MFNLAFLIASLLGFTIAQTTTTLQAESASLSGVTVSTSVPGYTGISTPHDLRSANFRAYRLLGSGYVDGFDSSSDSLTFTFTSATAGLYNLNILYNCPYGDKYTTVSVNSAGGSQFFLPGNKGWAVASAGQVALNAGSNTIQLQDNWGWYLIDAITLVAAAPATARKRSRCKGCIMIPLLTSWTTCRQSDSNAGQQECQ